MSASPVTLVGNLTADPKLDYLASGVAKLSFSIACNHYWQDQSGEKQEKVSYFNIVAWRNLAEDSGNVLSKGVRVVITGRLEQRSWDDKETGQKRSTVEVLADNIGVATSNIDSFTRKQTSGDRVATAPKATAPVRKAPAKPAQQILAEEEEPF